MFLKTATANSHVFITQSLFNENLSVTGYSLQTLLITFRRKNLRIQVLANIPGRLIFAFATFVLHISNMLMVQKVDLFSRIGI